MQDALHEMLMRIGDLTEQEIFVRCTAFTDEVKKWIHQLQQSRRIIEIPIAGESRWIAAEDAARFRDALGMSLPQGLPAAFLQTVATPLSDLIARYARTHGPFHLEEVAQRFGLGNAAVRMVLEGLETSNKVVQGEFRPGGSGREWADANVLRTLRLKSLAKLRKEVEPVEPSAYARFLPAWHSVASGRKGTEALLDSIEQLQGYPIPVSVLEKQILPARVRDYDPRDLDALLSSGIVMWTGVEPLGQNDGRIALYLTEHAPRLVRPPAEIEDPDPIHEIIRRTLSSSGAVFFPQILAATGNAFKVDVLRALWELVWAGEVTNDTLLPVRAILNAGKKKRKVVKAGIPESRLSVPPQGAGRWSFSIKHPGPNSR